MFPSSGSARAHGGMHEPPMRSLAWKYGYDAPINYDWNSLYCGGFNVSRRIIAIFVIDQSGDFTLKYSLCLLFVF